MCKYVALIIQQLILFCQDLSQDTQHKQSLTQKHMQTCFSIYFTAFENSGTLMERIGTDENPAGNYMFNVKNRNTRTRCEVCSKLTVKVRRRSGVCIVNFEYISHLVLAFLLLTLSR